MGQSIPEIWGFFGYPASLDLHIYFCIDFFFLCFCILSLI